MFIGDVCYYIEVKYNTIYQAFNRNKSKFVEDIDYLYLSKNRFIDKFQLLQNVKAKINPYKMLFFTLHGLLRLLRFTHSGLAEDFYDMWVDVVCELVESNQLTTGEFFLLNNKQEITPQILGATRHYLRDGRGVRSRGEHIIGNILLDLRQIFQYEFPLYLPEWVAKEVKWNKFPEDSNKLNPDFTILTIPKTIIEFWGRENDIDYDYTRKIKEKAYKLMKIKLIPIESKEVDNEPMLKKKLIKELKIKQRG
nr:MAG: PD-(D/E)XK nuclease [uncultured archaeon]